MCNFPAHVNATLLFVALQNHQIEKTTGPEVMLNLSCAVFVSTIPCAHDVDDRSTAGFHEGDALLCFGLSHSTYEHVVCLEHWHSVCCLFHHDSSVLRTSCSTCHAERYGSHVVQHSRGVCLSFRSSQGSGRFLFHQKCQASASAIARRSTSEASLPRMLRHLLPRRLPRPRHSTRFFHEESSQQV